MNSLTSSFSCLDIKYVLPFLGTKSSLRLIEWSHGFLVDILSGLTFLNTFSYLWNFCGTISFIFSLSSSISLSNFSFMVYSHLFLSAFSIFFILFLTFFLCSIFSFIVRFLSQSGRHLVIFTSPVSQFISGLCAVILLVNLQQKVAFDTPYTNKFLIRICSGTHYQSLECTKVLCEIVSR